MADGTKIEWTDATWNPITGCSVVSPGCTNCYAMKLAGTRLKHHPSRVGLTAETKAGPVWTGEVRFNEQWLGQPLKWTRPRRIFVCAHGDLFAEGAPDEWIDHVFAIMALCPRHVFQVLTKRPERMREYLSSRETVERVYDVVMDMAVAENVPAILTLPHSHNAAPAGNKVMLGLWPLPNVWLGVSVEDQRRADERIPILLGTPAAIRWISAEPLLGPVDIRQWQFDYGCGCGWGGNSPLDYCRECGWRGIAPGKHAPENCPQCAAAIDDYQACPECNGHDDDGLSFGPNSKPRLDWVVAGGESGPGARPMQPDWARALRDQCAAANVPFLFKQWGNHRPCSDADGPYMLPCSKAEAGRLLDGIEHNAFPEVR